MSDKNGEEVLEPEQERKIFVGGVNFKTTDDSLKAFYEQWGEITDVVVIKDKYSQKSKGFGYVTYKTSAMVDEAMLNRPHKIDGRQVQPKRAVPREETNPASHMAIKKIFIGGLKDKPITEEDIKNHFSQYGNITDCVLMKDKATGNPRGFAFVEFDDHDPVDKMMLQRVPHKIKDINVDVKKAIPKDAEMSPMGGGGRGGRGGMGRGGGMGGGRGGGMGGGGFGGGMGGGYGMGGGGGGGGYGMGGGGMMRNGGGWGGGQDFGGSSGYNDFGQSWGQSFGGGPMRGGFGGGRGPGPYGGGGGRW